MKNVERKENNGKTDEYRRFLSEAKYGEVFEKYLKEEFELDIQVESWGHGKVLIEFVPPISYFKDKVTTPRDRFEITSFRQLLRRLVILEFGLSNINNILKGFSREPNIIETRERLKSELERLLVKRLGVDCKEKLEFEVRRKFGVSKYD